jgi:hypothetical protein
MLYDNNGDGLHMGDECMPSKIIVVKFLNKQKVFGMEPTKQLLPAANTCKLDEGGSLSESNPVNRL